MRKQLGKLREQRLRFCGTFARYGTKKNWNGFPEKTILLNEIRVVGNDEIVTDHLWFNFTKAFAALGELQTGDVIEFDARVRQYVKGYFGHREDVWKPAQADWKLSHPTKLAKRVDDSETDDLDAHADEIELAARGVLPCVAQRDWDLMTDGALKIIESEARERYCRE